VDLVTAPALTRPDLLAASTRDAVQLLASRDPAAAARVMVAEIDPDLADTAALTEAYGLDLHASANCVLVVGKRGGDERFAGCVVRATTRADVNTVVRRLLDVRKATFLPTERAVQLSGMEYGGITPIGLPVGWRVLADDDVLADEEHVVVGSGVRRSKILLPGRDLAAFGVEAVEGLGR
jgi:prolyl-tRNA editing enzyme YbaK/EbsC (Cys-tRNA(Pro) deacylase)